MFRLSALRAIEEYAVALYTGGIRRAPLAEAVATRWAPFHELIGQPRLPELPPAPIFWEISPGGNAMIMPPVPLALTRAAMFPILSSAPEAERGELPAVVELERLVAGLLPPSDQLASYAFEPLYAWMQRFATHLPATVGGPSLSLFRQFALASALFAASGGHVPAQQFTLVGSDLPGIQRFIATRLVSKGIAKGLRGRSAFLQLVTDAIARRLLDELQLPRANLLFAAGGNVLLLAPPGVEEQLRAIRRDISSALLAWSDGTLDHALAWVPLAADLVGGDAGPALRRLRQELGAAKRRPYGDLLASGEGYEAIFAAGTGDASAAPPNDYDDLAEALARQAPGGSLYLHRQRRSLPAGAAAWQRALHLVSGGWHYDVNGVPRPVHAAVDHLVDAINEPERVPKEATGFRFVGNTTPHDPDGSIREIEQIAKVTPMGRIGVLRMDVDNLGVIFGRALQPATLAAVCTLSEALDRFFSGWLNVVCREVETSRDLAGVAPVRRGDLLYTIYSGGDDLFVVGAWDRLPLLADAIRRDFADYCAHNPALHVSAGIAIETARFPLYQLADRAAEALDAAKDLRHQLLPGEKNALSFLGYVLPWEAFPAVRALAERLTTTKSEPSALLGRLRDLAQLDREERQRVGLPPLDPFGESRALVGRAHWRGMVALRRAIDQDGGKDAALTGLLRELEEQLIAGKLTPHLELIARWADLLWRKSVDDGDGRE